MIGRITEGFGFGPEPYVVHIHHRTTSSSTRSSFIMRASTWAVNSPTKDPELSSAGSFRVRLSLSPRVSTLRLLKTGTSTGSSSSVHSLPLNTSDRYWPGYSCVCLKSPTGDSAERNTPPSISFVHRFKKVWWITCRTHFKHIGVS